MIIRCKQCAFKDIDGGKYPCNVCSEIMDIKRVKCTENHFEQISDNYGEFQREIQSKKRLKQKLSQMMTSTNKEIICSEYAELEDGNIMLTSFLNDGKDIVIYQIVDVGNRLLQNVVRLDRKFINIK